MNTREIARAYGMPSRVASLIAKDPSQFKYWIKCGEAAYNGCLKWVDTRECCAECLLCQRCCRARAVCGKAELAKVDQLAASIVTVKAAHREKPEAVQSEPVVKKPVSQSTMPEKESMPIPGKMEITIKVSQFPADIRTTANGWKEFVVDVGGREVTITVRPKVFAKLEQAQQNFPAWVAAIAGKMGQATEKGFILDEPNIQVFEKKPKVQEAKAEA